MSQNKAIILGIIGFVILISFFIFSPFRVISAGERGVVLIFGEVQDNILDEGLHFVIPIITKVQKLDVKTQKDEVSASAASKDLQIVTTRIALNYHLDPDGVNTLWQEVGKDYNDRIIAPAIQEAIKAVTARYTAEELITKRPQVKDETRTMLTERLIVNHIIVDNFSIIDFNFSEQFNAAIEAKQVAEQDALRATRELDKIRIQAEQKIATARAEAEAIRIKAQAITQQGGREFVNLKAVEKWNGVLPTQMIPGGTVPFINL